MRGGCLNAQLAIQCFKPGLIFWFMHIVNVCLLLSMLCKLCTTRDNFYFFPTWNAECIVYWCWISFYPRIFILPGFLVLSFPHFYFIYLNISKEYVFHSSLSDFQGSLEINVNNAKNIFFSFLTIRLSRLTRNKCKQCKEYFFHSSLSDFQDSLEEINVNNAKNIFFIPHYKTFKTH